MKLTDTDVKVLDLLADDYFSLAEACGYCTQIELGSDAEKTKETCRSRIRAYFDDGLIEVFVGSMSKNDFRKIADEAVPGLLNEANSWARAAGKDEIVAISTTKKAETLLAQIGRSK